MSTQDGWRVGVEVASQRFERLERCLEEGGVEAFEVHDATTFDEIAEGRVRAVAYVADRRSAEAIAATVRAALPEAVVVSAPFEDKAWLEHWKQFVQPAVIAGRIVVRPAFVPSPRPELPEVVIDPGLAFGTGGHETTRLAGALAIDALVRPTGGRPAPDRALDVGCGSGVLACVLARLGCPRVEACDVDPEAVRVARDVCAANGVSEQVDVRLGSCEALSAPAPLVVANILAPVLLELAPALRRLTRPGGVLVVSGILEAEADDFLEAFAAATEGRVEGVAVEGEWFGARWRIGALP